MLDLATLLLMGFWNTIITAIIDVRIVLSPCQSDLRVSTPTSSYVTMYNAGQRPM